MSDYIDTVNIEGTQYDIQDTVTKQTADQNEGDIEQIKKMTGFSVTEVNTGEKWIDGKDIYKAVFTGTTPSTPSGVIPFTGISRLIHLFGALRQEIGGVIQNDIPLNTYWDNNYSITVIYNYPSETFYVRAIGGYVNQSFWFTALYTK